MTNNVKIISKTVSFNAANKQSFDRKPIASTTTTTKRGGWGVELICVCLNASTENGKVEITTVSVYILKTFQQHLLLMRCTEHKQASHIISCFFKSETNMTTGVLKQDQDTKHVNFGGKASFSSNKSSMTKQQLNSETRKCTYLAAVKSNEIT